MFHVIQRIQRLALFPVCNEPITKSDPARNPVIKKHFSSKEEDISIM